MSNFQNWWNGSANVPADQSTNRMHPGCAISAHTSFSVFDARLMHLCNIFSHAEMLCDAPLAEKAKRYMAKTLS